MSARRIVLAAATAAAAAALLAPAALARPAPPPPDRPQVGPPPAWLEAGSGDAWLAYSSYCWTAGGRGLCADYVAPERRTDLPRIAVGKGERLRVHLGVIPSSVAVFFRGHRLSVARSRILEFHVRRSGVLLVTLLHRRGDAGYAARLVAPR